MMNFKQKSGNKESFPFYVIIIFTIVLFIVSLLCIFFGSVDIGIVEIADIFLQKGMTSDVASSVIVSVRLPRVICVALEGGALSLCGAAMQGLLHNPLADGSTIGVASGASLGAVLAIAFGISIPFMPSGGVMAMSILFSFVSLIFILALTYKLDGSLATNTIILIGVIFSMFTSSIINFIITLVGNRVKTIVFWTMGSLSGSSYEDVIILTVASIFLGGVIISLGRELNAFALGEDNARNIGVPVKKVKLIILICISSLTGICVSIGGIIGFVGLIIPHICRMIFGPNHKRLLPASWFTGAIFLMLADLFARTILNPKELPIGVITSFIGSIFFVYVFLRNRAVT